MKYLISLMLLLNLCGNCLALDCTQKEILRYAYQYGNSIKYLNQGWGETIASIVYQETKAGHNIYRTDGVIIGDKRNKHNSYGVMQIQLPAARDVEKWYPNLFKDYFGDKSPNNNQLKLALLKNYRFNIRVGSHYFLKMLQLTGNYRKGILAYNAGFNNNGYDKNRYVSKVIEWKRKIISDIVFEIKLAEAISNYKNGNYDILKTIITIHFIGELNENMWKDNLLFVYERRRFLGLQIDKNKVS